MGIHTNYFIHPVDKVATEGLRTVPGFDAVCKKVSEIADEKAFLISATASMIKLGPNQYPSIYNKLVKICEKLEMDVPELYLGWNGNNECEVFGDTKVFITLNAGLFWMFDENEIETVLAQACGHVLCHHGLYNYIADAIEQSGQTMVGGLISWAIVSGVSGALKFWRRCSNFTADNIAAYYHGSSAPVINMLSKYAGGAPCVPGEMNIEAFIEQGKDYKRLMDKSIINKLLVSAFNPLTPEHPFTSFRAASVRDFWNSFNYEEYEKLAHQGSETKVLPEKISQKDCKFELLFTHTRVGGVQFLASKIRNFMANDPLHVDIQGVRFDLAPSKIWANTLQSGSYKIMIRTHNRTMDYMLHLSSDIRLIVEWDDKSQTINCREEPLTAPVPEPIKVEPEKSEQ